MMYSETYSTRLFPSDSAAVAKTLWQVFCRSHRADANAEARSEETESLESVFTYLAMRLMHASDKGHVAVQIKLVGTRANASESIADNDYSGDIDVFLRSLRMRSETFPDILVSTSIFSAMRSTGILVEADEMVDIDRFERVVPFVWKPLDETSGLLYLTRHFREEWHVANDIAQRLLTPPAFSPVPGRLDELLAIEADNPFRNPEQLQAVENAGKRSFAVITGGPGTGKTTSVANLLALFLSDDPNAEQPRIALAAPTGKATARMRESLNASINDTRLTEKKRAFLAPLAKAMSENRIPALTLDRWLVTNTAAGKRPEPGNPLEADLFVVDEASMIDVNLAYRLFRILDQKTRVVLLGDENQLAAVGPGAVFAELAGFDLPGESVPVTSRLKKSWRYPDESDIGRIASAICAGNAEALLGSYEHGLHALLKCAGNVEERDKLSELLSENRAMQIQADACILSQEDLKGSSLPPAARQWIEGRISPYIEALNAYLDAFESGADSGSMRDHWKALTRALEHFRFLCAARNGMLGVSMVNAFVENAVLKSLEDRPRTSEEAPAASALAESIHLAIKQRKSSTLSGWHAAYPGEVIIIRKNDRGLDVVNGDIAVVLPDAEGSPTIARLIDGERDLPLALLPAYETAFAMTIHQSQGSEYGVVGVFMPASSDSPLATRELLYTGVTRAKKKVRIFTTLPTLKKAVQLKTKRTSGLASSLGTRLEKIKNRN